MSEALLKLIRALAILGFSQDRLHIHAREEESRVVEFNPAPGAKVEIIVTGQYWACPGLVSYFVNYHHDNGDFMANCGTPHIERALFDLGQAMAMIPAISTKN